MINTLLEVYWNCALLVANLLLSCIDKVMTIWRLNEFKKLILRQWCSFAHSKINFYPIIFRYVLLEIYWFSALLVINLLNYELYWQSYDRLKVGWVSEVDWPLPIIVKHAYVKHHARFVSYICLWTTHYSCRRSDVAGHIGEAQ